MTRPGQRRFDFFSDPSTLNPLGADTNLSGRFPEAYRTPLLQGLALESHTPVTEPNPRALHRQLKTNRTIRLRSISDPEQADNSAITDSNPELEGKFAAESEQDIDSVSDTASEKEVDIDIASDSDSDLDMATAGTLGVPDKFSGTNDRHQIGTFISAFERFADYKRIQDGQRPSAFRMLLMDGAAMHFDRLPGEIQADYEQVRENFRRRYRLREVSRLDKTGEIWQTKQKLGENVLDYIDRVQCKAHELEMAENEIKNIVLKGMNESIRKVVLQNNHDTLEQVLNTADEAQEFVSEHDTDLMTTVKRLETNLDKLNVSLTKHQRSVKFAEVASAEPCGTRPPGQSANRSHSPDRSYRSDRLRSPGRPTSSDRSPSPWRSDRSPSPWRSDRSSSPWGQDRSYNRERSQQRSNSGPYRDNTPYRHDIRQQGRSNHNGSGSRSSNPNPYRQREGRPQQNSRFNDYRSSCSRCGKRHGQRGCLAEGRTCFRCNRPGHLAVVCRQARE